MNDDFPRKYDIALDRETLRNYISFGGKTAVWTREPNGSAQNQVHEMRRYALHLLLEYKNAIQFRVEHLGMTNHFPVMNVSRTIYVAFKTKSMQKYKILNKFCNKTRVCDVPSITASNTIAMNLW